MNPKSSLPVRATLLLSLVLAAGPALPSSAAVLDLNGSEAHISGLAPGGRAAVLAVSRERSFGTTRVQRVHLVAVDDDGDGVAILPLDHPASPTSVWIVVDLATGETSIQAPAAFGVREMAVDPRRLRQAAGRLIVDREDLEILAVRPGIGAWSLSLHDGGDLDGDRTADGAVTVDLLDLQPLGDEAAALPDDLAPGDVIAVIDPRRLEVFAVRIES